MSSPPRGFVLVQGNGTNVRGGAQTDLELQARGWHIDVGYYTLDGTPTVQNLIDGGYSFLGIDASFWGVYRANLTLAYEAYNAGLNVLTTGNDTTWAPENPVWGGSVNTGATSSQLIPVTPNTAESHPVSMGWSAWNDTDAKIYLSNVRSTAKVVGNFTYQGNPVPAIIAEENPNGNGARYIHSEPYLSNAPAGLWDSLSSWLSRPGGMVQVWDGTAWVYRPVNVWDGSKWVKRPLKAWDGTAWKNI